MISIPVTAVLMRIKGGGHGYIKRRIEQKFGVEHDEKKKMIQPVTKVQAALHWALDGSRLSGFGFFILCLFYVSWWQAVLAGLFWIITNSMSLAEEIGNIGGIKGNWSSSRDSWFGSKALTWIKNDRIWGWTSGALRGAFLGSCLALATFNPWFILMGSTFPLCYFIGVSIKQYEIGKIQAGWNWSEWIYGAVLGISFLV